jgi:hypothetical protein
MRSSDFFRNRIADAIEHGAHPTSTWQNMSAISLFALLPRHGNAARRAIG